MTKYAQQILDLVLCSTEHPTAEQIFLQMKQENSKIAQATVYNNLNALVADGKLIRLSQPGAPDLYDNTTRHDHLICTRCGALADFKFIDLTHNIEAALGARIQSYDLRIHYLCPACRTNSESVCEDGRIFIYATRDIKKGEEILYNYGYAFENFIDHPCKCGFPECVGYIVAVEDRLKLKKRLRGKKPKKSRLDTSHKNAHI